MQEVYETDHYWVATFMMLDSLYLVEKNVHAVKCVLYNCTKVLPRKNQYDTVLGQIVELPLCHIVLQGWPYTPNTDCDWKVVCLSCPV